VIYIAPESTNKSGCITAQEPVRGKTIDNEFHQQGKVNVNINIKCDF